MKSALTKHLIGLREYVDLSICLTHRHYSSTIALNMKSKLNTRFYGWFYFYGAKFPDAVGGA